MVHYVQEIVQPIRERSEVAVKPFDRVFGLESDASCQPEASTPHLLPLSFTCEGIRRVPLSNYSTVADSPLSATLTQRSPFTRFDPSSPQRLGSLVLVKEARPGLRGQSGLREVHNPPRGTAFPCTAARSGADRGDGSP